MKKLLLLLLALFIIALPAFAEESEKAVEESKPQLEKTISSAFDPSPAETEKQEQIDELRFISQLPAKMQELLDESRKEAKKVIDELKKGHLKAQETVAVMDTIRDNDKEGISNEGMGEYVREQVRSGKRGRELSDSIKRENSKRREAKQQMKRERKGDRKGGKGKGKKYDSKEEVKKGSEEGIQMRKKVFQMEKRPTEETTETDKTEVEKKKRQITEKRVFEMEKKPSDSNGGN